jgi:DNA repair protein RadC
MTMRLTKSQKIQVLCSQDVYRIMQQILLREEKIDRNREHAWIISLSANDTILNIELISLGSATATIAEPMDVFSLALEKRAIKIIMVHNHPSGSVEPSPEDVALTDRMQAIGFFVKVPVMDHFIITETSYYSFLDDGLMDTIKKNSKFDLTFQEVDRLRGMMDQVNEKHRQLEKEHKAAKKEKAALKRKLNQKDSLLQEEAQKRQQAESEKEQAEAALKAKDIKTAKTLLRQGISVSVIQKATGLSKKEIAALE